MTAKPRETAERVARRARREGAEAPSQAAPVIQPIQRTPRRGPPLASWLIASYQRPRFLWHCIEHIVRNEVPRGWKSEVVVCLPEDDPGRETIAALADKWPVPIRAVSSVDSSDAGTQMTTALFASRGELAVCTGDDDLHSPRRLTHAIGAYERGAVISGAPSTYMVNGTGTICYWDGGRGAEKQIGSTYNFDARLLRAVGGWGPNHNSVDSAVMARMPYPIERLPDALGLETVCCEIGAHLNTERPFPHDGERATCGLFTVRGRGHYRDAVLPAHTRAALDELCAG